jgi:hypothetical protein
MVQRLAQQGQGMLKIDDVDIVAGAEDVRRHARIPIPGLVAKVNTGFKQLTHRNIRHDQELQMCGLSLRAPQIATCFQAPSKL